MAGRLNEIVFDSDHLPRLARFWAAVLAGYAVRRYDAAETARLAALGLAPETDPVVMVDGPRPALCFHLMPRPATEPRPPRNRMHLDIMVADVAAEVTRLTALGATLRRQTSGYTVLTDPEGNNFCLVPERPAPA